MLSPYLSIFLFMLVISVLCAIMLVLPRLFASNAGSKNKNMPYECGFDAFGDSFNTFDIRFYLVGILFIVFDVEIIFLFPWAVTLTTLGKVGFFSMMFFLGILTIGFIYEIISGALEWN